MHFPEIFLTQAESSSQQDRERPKTQKKLGPSRENRGPSLKKKKRSDGNRKYPWRDTEFVNFEEKKQGKCDFNGETREIERDILRHIEHLHQFSLLRCALVTHI